MTDETKEQKERVQIVHTALMSPGLELALGISATAASAGYLVSLGLWYFAVLPTVVMVGVMVAAVLGPGR